VTRTGYLGQDLIFLVGAPRSGTTWLQRLLATHPQIGTGQESHLFSEFIGPQLRMWRKHAEGAGEERGGVGPGCYHSEEEFHRILREYMLALLEPIIARDDASTYFLEKTPGHALFLPEIHALLPCARFIHIIRDPRDVVASLVGAAASWGRSWAPRSTARAATLWVRHVESAVKAGRMLTDEQYTEVRYEDLQKDGSQALSRLFRFIGVESPPDLVESALFNNSAEAHRSGGGTPIPLGGIFAGEGGQVEEPRGFIGEARVGGWNRRLSPVQRAIVWAIVSRPGRTRY
jgi:hypothetical protein